MNRGKGIKFAQLKDKANSIVQQLVGQLIYDQECFENEKDRIFQQVVRKSQNDIFSNSFGYVLWIILNSSSKGNRQVKR
jgi:hypothetical protein